MNTPSFIIIIHHEQHAVAYLCEGLLLRVLPVIHQLRFVGTSLTSEKYMTGTVKLITEACALSFCKKPKAALHNRYNQGLATHTGRSSPASSASVI